MEIVFNIQKQRFIVFVIDQKYFYRYCTLKSSLVLHSWKELLHGTSRYGAPIV